MIEDWLNLLAGNDYNEPRLVELLKTMDIPTRDALIVVAIDSTDYTPEQARALCTPKADKANTADAQALAAYVDWWHGWDRWAYERILNASILDSRHSLTAIVAGLYANNIHSNTLLSD